MRDLPAVFWTAARLFARHWPALLTIAFLGAAVRSAAQYVAVQASDVNGQLGLLVLLLAPLGYLAAMVWMLSLCRPSLPALVAAHEVEGVAPTERRRLRLVDVAVSVLVPFMLAYESYDLLAEDLERFRNAAAFAEFNRFSLSEDLDYDFQGRLGIYPLQIALMIVAVAWVVRWALGQVERRVHVMAIAFVGAFVELYYTSQLASQIVVIRLRGEAWLRDRVAAGWIESWYGAVVDFLGPVAGAFRWVVDATETLTGSLSAVVVVPIAWLAFGAVVLGYTLLDTSDPADDAKGFWRSLWRDVKGRWSSLIQGLRLLTTAGLGPMLVFSLVFLIVVRVPSLLGDLVRTVIGPQEYGISVALQPAIIALGFALSMALTAPLLAAAIDWLVRTRAALRSQAAPTTPADA